MFYLINKPQGISSFQAIRDFAKAKNINKIGHTGTLDPLASGLLLVATDEDTKLIEYVDQGYKTYRATMEMNKVSDTFDSTGKITELPKKEFTVSEIKKGIEWFLGSYEQVPPNFSAKRVNGYKAYELARKGEAVNLKPATVEIKEVRHVKKVGPNLFEFEVVVSRGTYIRSLINDIGCHLGDGAIMVKLERIAIGSFTEPSTEKPIRVRDLLTIPVIEIDDLKSLFQGKLVPVVNEDGLYALENNDWILGIVAVENHWAKGVKLFGEKFRKLGY